MSDGMNKLIRHLHTPESHRYFWQCVGAIIAGHYIYEGLKMVVMGVFYE